MNVHGALCTATFSLFSLRDDWFSFINEVYSSIHCVKVFGPVRTPINYVDWSCLMFSITTGIGGNLAISYFIYETSAAIAKPGGNTGTCR